MNGLTGKVLLVTAGAAVGALGYMAWRHRDELKGALGGFVELGVNLAEKKMESMAEGMPRPENGQGA